MFDPVCIHESFAIKHQEFRNLNPLACQLRARIEAGIEQKEAKEKVDIKIDRSRDLEGQILEIRVIIAIRKATGRTNVLSSRRKAR